MMGKSRRSVRAAAVAALAAAFLLAWLAPQPQLAEASTGHGTRAPKPASKSALSGVTVAGPRMWDPATSSPFAHHSWVTVSQTKDLVNQMVQVSWKNFTPSSQLLYDPSSTDYPVMVAECAGAHPTKFSQCFGADNGGVPGSFSSYGPMNTSYATTAADGTGQLDIQILTAQENQQLGCDLGHPCSLVIVPSQGGNVFQAPPKCSDHSQDAGQSDIGAVAFSSSTGSCSWHDRIIVPLTFARTPLDCAIKNPAFSVVGSPMLARAMAQWQSALCSGGHPLSIQYDSALNEPLARQDFLAGTDDVALTTLPATAKGVHPYTYAPVAISSIAVAYWMDNPVTGKPYRKLRFNQRLLLKLITQSYNFDNEGCGHDSKSAGCDNAVDGDPLDMFADPEFRSLNPHIANVGDGYQVPTVLSGESDMTWELTRWIAANPQASGFVKGQFDPWGEHVNTDYLNLALPTSALTSMDPYPLIAHRYTPVFPLSQVAQYQADNWYPATNWQQDQTGNYPKLQPEIPGNRALIAILDAADAAAYQFPVAALPNGAGNYVTPTPATMRAALSDMRTAGNHVTEGMTANGRAAKAYPLTMVIYAMVPTGGISKAKAAKIAQFLDFVATRGQTPGTSPGDLPSGYLPLPPAMRAQALAAASKVMEQAGNPKPSPQPSVSSPSPTPSPAPLTQPIKLPPAIKQAQVRDRPQVRLGFVSNPASTGAARYALPVLLTVGALLTAFGASGMVGDRIGWGVVARLGRLRRRGLARRRKKS